MTNFGCVEDFFECFTNILLMKNFRRVEDLLFRRKQIKNKMGLMLSNIVAIEDLSAVP